jgi:TPR repeat protein
MKWEHFLHFLPALFLAANLGCQSAGNGTSVRHTFQDSSEESDYVVGGNLTKAENGDAEAQYYIGKFYGKTGNDYNAAVHWLSLSTAQGNEKAKKLLPEIIKASDESKAKAK